MRAAKQVNRSKMKDCGGKMDRFKESQVIIREVEEEGSGGSSDVQRSTTEKDGHRWGEGVVGRKRAQRHGAHFSFCNLASRLHSG